MLSELQLRLTNTREKEIDLAGQEQLKIAFKRMEKLA
jgi:hypothetical protein